jgi:iron complex outermembrane receptor protein
MSVSQNKFVSRFAPYLKSGVNRKSQLSASAAPWIVISLLAANAVATSPAWADDQALAAAAPDQTGDHYDEIIVTGTRTSRKVEESPVPIQVLSNAELQETGKLNIRDDLQQLVPSFYNSGGWVGQAGEAVKSASLRGLQGDQVLVLVNGERRHDTSLIFYGAPTNNGASPADLDLIPASAIDHIEILTDGAAAQYGSDALAGVINIILKTGSDGGDASFTYGRYASSPSGPLSAYGGTEQALFDDGVPLGDQGGFLHVSVDLAFHDNTNQLGPATAYNPLYGVTSKIANYTQLFLPGDPREATANRYVGDQGLPISQTYNFGYNLELPLNDDIKFYSFTTGSHQFAENFGIFRPASSKQNIPSIYPNGFLPQFIVLTDDFQFNAGLKGLDLHGWNWKAGSSISRSDANERDDHSINTSLGPNSPTDFNNGNAVTTEWVNTLDVNRPFDLGYFSHPLSVALGAEYRLDGYDLKPGQIESYEEGPYVFPQGYYFTGHPAAGASGLGGFTPNGTPRARSNIAGYFDLEQKLTDAWDLGVAGRFEHYSDVGNTESGKVSTRYQIIPELAIRGSISNGFRAPSLQQEYYSSSIPNYIFVNGVGNILGNAYVSPPGSAVAKLFGAQPLKPEKSVDYTVGVVAEPVDGLHVTADLYDIRIDNRIVQSGTITGASVNTLLLANGLQPGSVAYYMNGVSTTTAGLDLSADYTTPLNDGWGSVKWSLTSAFNRSYINSLPATPAIVKSLNLSIFPYTSQQQLINGFPKNRTTIGAQWSIGKFGIDLRESRYSGVAYPYQDTIATSAHGGVPVYAENNADPKLITDIDITYSVNDQLRVTIGANNLFNTFPSQLSQKAQLEYGWFAQNPVYNEYSPFGYNGGFYYARVSYNW